MGSIKRKFFLSTEDKDKVERIRHKEDYELKDYNRYGQFPSYDPEVVLESFTERDENADRNFFASKWGKMKQNIIGQTMWVVGIYIFFYYMVQILFVQGAVNACIWVGSNTEEHQSQSNVEEKYGEDLIEKYEKYLNDTSDQDKEYGRIECALKFARFVESWETKQKR